MPSFEEFFDQTVTAVHKREQLTAVQLRELLHYDPDTGDFIWLKPTSNRVYIGKKAVYKSHGYPSIRIHGYLYHAHRLAWLYMTGEWPPEQIDHIDKSRDNNKWSNLRLASNSENSMNKPLQSNNKSGYAGVDKFGNRWRARIHKDNKEIHLGLFDEPEEAALAYYAAFHRLFPTYAPPIPEKLLNYRKKEELQPSDFALPISGHTNPNTESSTDA